MRTTCPIFIIGGSRTGSTMLQDMLGNGPDAALLPEAHLLTPPWLHRDFSRALRARFGRSGPGPGDVDALVDFMYSGEPFGALWNAALKRRRLIAPAAMRNALADTDLSLKAILDVCMALYAERFDKPRAGAKFPVHFGHAGTLLQWYPECRLLHTIRDPRASLASQLKRRTSATAPRLVNAWAGLQHFTHINLQYRWQTSVHRRLADDPRYRVVKYEDVLAQPEEQLGQICAFLGIRFDSAMLTPTMSNSSFDARRWGEAAPIDASAGERWRRTLSPGLQRLVNGIQRSRLGVFGYPNA